MPKNVIPKRKITVQEKEQIIEAASRGVPNLKISEDLKINGQTVNGICQAARFRGELGKKEKAISPETISEPSLFQPSLIPSEPQQEISPMSTAPVQASPAQIQALPNDFNPAAGRPVLGTSGGFIGSGTQGVKFVVERIVPADGLVGSHFGNFSVDELGNLYGSGTYRVVRTDPGRAAPTEFVQKISESFGPPKSGSTGATTNNGAPPRSSMPYMPSQGDPVTRSMDVMERIYDRSLKQIEQARTQSPDASVAEIFRQQQTLMREQFAEERKRDELRREDERKREEARREDERIRYERDRQLEVERHERERVSELARFERDQRASKEAHERECQRIKQDNEARLKMESEQREFLLKLETKKLDIVKEQTAMAQQRLETEIKLSRDQAVAIQAAAAKEIERSREETKDTIAEAEKRAESERKREREFREKEFALKQSSIDKEFELNTKIVDLKNEKSGDSISSVLGIALKEGGKALNSITDLARIKAMSPEAQAAYLASQGVAVQQPQGQQNHPQHEAAEHGKSEPAQSHAPQNGNGNGNGHSHAAHSKPDVEKMIVDQLGTPSGQSMIEEWALNVEVGSDAMAFSSLFVELCRSYDEEKRMAAVAFAAFMKVRKWEKIYGIIRPGLKPQVQQVLDKPEAEPFYEQFRALVHIEFTNYWEAQVAERMAKAKEGKPEVPAAAEPAEPAAPAVPTREALRKAINETEEAKEATA